MSHGSSIRRNQEGDADRIDGYDCADYDEYIREDLGSRVFVDFDVFMKRVLHVPDDWKTRWGPVIDAVKANAEFSQSHERYCELCEEIGTLDKFYQVLTDTTNAILNVVSGFNFEGIPSKEPHQHYRVNDPKHVRGGVMNKMGLSSDLVLVHENFHKKNPAVHWANPLQVLEVKPYDNALCDGTTVPRLIVDGKCKTTLDIQLRPRWK